LADPPAVAIRLARNASIAWHRGHGKRPQPSEKVLDGRPFTCGDRDDLAQPTASRGAVQHKGKPGQISWALVHRTLDFISTISKCAKTFVETVMRVSRWVRAIQDVATSSAPLAD